MAGIDYELNLLGKLVSINTDVSKKTGYSECARLIADEMKAIGLKVDIYDPVAKTGDGKPRPNVVGALDAGAKKTIGLIAHYDVVPPGEGGNTTLSSSPSKATRRMGAAQPMTSPQLSHR